MRLSELLKHEVVDGSGKSLGEVQDVRLVQDGPNVGTFGPSLRVDGVVIGRRAAGVRLGYHRDEVKGPWVLRALFRRLEKRGRFARWDQLEIGDDRIIVRGELDDIPV
jgi:hypothetical protein